MEKQKASFSPLLSDDESSRSSTDTDVNFPGQTLTSIGWKTHMFGRWYLVALLCSIIILILTTATLIMLVILNHKSSSNQKLAIQSSVWSPLIEADVVEYQETTWNNAFGVQNIYRGPPTPEREAAWENLTFTTEHGVIIPENKISLFNEIDPSKLVRVPSEFGPGYNLVRKYTWMQIGRYAMPPTELNSTAVGNRMHVDHCIEALMRT
ncbi:hypothetical protein G7Y89_g15637 [Cudoniella acicularis]|uniref:Uncharacterized protein n=1 Tax=Cudoniella acicularis TaxID=354080 RepID=A0A8H4QHU3_9HELO|nr:hypothetical protein G7Y89_g15637 [Cudoniella acicularis]